jgi:hypothetical protein
MGALSPAGQTTRPLREANERSAFAWLLPRCRQCTHLGSLKKSIEMTRERCCRAPPERLHSPGAAEVFMLPGPAVERERREQGSGTGCLLSLANVEAQQTTAARSSPPAWIRKQQ